MVKEDFIKMLNNGVPAMVVINHMSLHYDKLLNDVVHSEVCTSCVDRDECDTIDWLNLNIKKASQDMIVENFTTKCRCIYFKKQQ